LHEQHDFRRGRAQTGDGQVTQASTTVDQAVASSVNALPMIISAFPPGRRVSCSCPVVSFDPFPLTDKCPDLRENRSGHRGMFTKASDQGELGWGWEVSTA
jgi:hypothetical protein